MKYGRKLERNESIGKDISEIINSMPKYNVYEDYIQCPSCKRNYAPGPAEKHIEKCKNIIHKPKLLANSTIDLITLDSNRKQDLKQNH